MTDFSKIRLENLRPILNFKTISKENLNFAERFGNFLPNFFTNIMRVEINGKFFWSKFKGIRFRQTRKAI
jgi:hypothetical protein